MKTYMHAYVYMTADTCDWECSCMVFACREQLWQAGICIVSPVRDARYTTSVVDMSGLFHFDVIVFDRIVACVRLYTCAYAHMQLPYDGADWQQIKDNYGITDNFPLHRCVCYAGLRSTQTFFCRFVDTAICG